MVTAYIDVAKEPGINDVPAPTATSTVTKKVRLAWDTTLTRSEVARTAREIAAALEDGQKMGETHFAD